MFNKSIMDNTQHETNNIQGHLQQHFPPQEANSQFPSEQYGNVYTDSPTAPLIDEDVEGHSKEEGVVDTKPDPRRFYILMVFSLLAFTQSGVSKYSIY